MTWPENRTEIKWNQFMIGSGFVQIQLQITSLQFCKPRPSSAEWLKNKKALAGSCSLPTCLTMHRMVLCFANTKLFLRKRTLCSFRRHSSNGMHLKHMHFSHFVAAHGLFGYSHIWDPCWGQCHGPAVGDQVRWGKLIWTELLTGCKRKTFSRSKSN